MYEVSVTRGFRASHALMLRGEREPLHWHDWKVVVTVAGETLDNDGMLLDFHALEQSLDTIIRGWEGKHLNDVLPTEFGNASTEQVATFIAVSMMESLPGGGMLRRVEVTEAPHCVARWIA